MINTERIAKALGHLRDGLAPKCQETWQGFYGDDWLTQLSSKHRGTLPSKPLADVSFLLNGLKSTWPEIFAQGFGPATRSLVFEVAEARNKWAHQESFSSDDTVRALDSMERLLEDFGITGEQEAIRKLRRDLLRRTFEEEARSEYRKQAEKLTKGDPQAGLTPWRDIITPHSDVRFSENFYQAEFAANLHEVHQGRAEDEYNDPHLFFARTFLTQGLEDLLVGAAKRLSSQGGEPVIELQTNFGGGKTHSMIALYHLASGVPTKELPGVSDLLQAQGIQLPANINRAVLVGHQISVSTPAQTEDGLELRTLWGRLAYQLGGKAGYELVKADDEAGTSPGAALTELFQRFGPAIVLIDEWVAYARQLPENTEDRKRPAGGDFDTQFTFAQALTEAAASVPNVVLLITIPASDIEVGSERGRTALDRLKNVVARTASEWQPATPTESFEIVRRRLFEAIAPESGRIKDGVVRAFSEMYRKQTSDFPSSLGEAEYRRLMESSYPVHPELFNRLFVEWSALDRFQRTRGVLRLMAITIAELWQRGDQSLLLMSGNLPMDSSQLTSELRKYLDDGWESVIKADVDGENSLPLKLDNQYPNLGRLSASRRTARTIYMGSAPRPDGSRGVDIKEVMLGCVQPGEKVGPFSDALRHLTGEATHLYVDGEQYWYSLVMNVARMAKDRAESNFGDYDADDEVGRRLRWQQDRGSFSAVQVFAEGPGDVPDDSDGVRLVILAPSVTHSGNDLNSSAVGLAGEIFKQREAGPRVNQNMMVFVAAAANRLVELRGATRHFLAWKSINEDESLELSDHQKRQAQSKEAELSQQVDSLIGETFIHVLAPRKKPGEAELLWDMSRAAASGDIAARVSKKLETEERLIARYSGVRLRMDLDKFKLWGEPGDGAGAEAARVISVGELWKYYASLPYLPRLASVDVLLGAVSNGTSNMAWDTETFGYAQAYNEIAEAWLGVSRGAHVMADLSGFVLHPEVVPVPEQELPSDDHDTGETGEGEDGGETDTEHPDHSHPVPDITRFYARFILDRVRGSKELGDILENVTRHLGDDVELKLEINSTRAEGYSQETQRTVKENSNTLKAAFFEFE